MARTIKTVASFSSSAVGGSTGGSVTVTVGDEVTGSDPINV